MILSNTPSSDSIAFSSDYALIVHCHLRWDFVWQRPQQFHSRLSQNHPILFVEGPQVKEGLFAPYYSLYSDERFPNITILQMFFCESDWSKGGEFVDATRRILLDQALRNELVGRFSRSVQWFYDPMAVASHLGQHGSIATVYDCMDELSQFKFAPPELISRERRLLYAADVVFAGGRKMRDLKIRFNPNTHFYGCGVDVGHFGTARHDSTPIPADIAHLEGPVLGYFGVVDERLDYQLIEKLAKACPNWHVVMIGPTAKVSEVDLPQAPNLHWLGGRSYSELPAYTKRFDVALMPFALNEATEFINPTKALEYMASGTPVLSTPVPDVVSNFGKTCKILDSHEEFICEAWKQVQLPDKLLIERGLAMANDNTWEAIVAKMENHIAEALSKRAAIERRLRVQVDVPLVPRAMHGSQSAATSTSAAVTSSSTTAA